MGYAERGLKITNNIDRGSVVQVYFHYYSITTVLQANSLTCCLLHRPIVAPVLVLKALYNF